MNNAEEQPTHQDIAVLARIYWETSGHVEGKDEENWARAEAYLRAQLNQTGTSVNSTEGE